MVYEVFIVGTRESFCIRDTFEWTYGELRYSLVPKITEIGFQLKYLYVLQGDLIDVPDIAIPTWYTQNVVKASNALFGSNKGIVLRPEDSHPKEFATLMDSPANFFLWAVVEQTNFSIRFLIEPVAAPPSCH